MSGPLLALFLMGIIGFGLGVFVGLWFVGYRLFLRQINCDRCAHDVLVRRRS